MHEAEIVMRVAIIRIERDGAAAMVEGLVEPTLDTVHLAEVAMTQIRIGALRQRALDAVDRLRKLAASKMRHARTVQRMPCVLVEFNPGQSYTRARKSSVRGSVSPAPVLSDKRDSDSASGRRVFRSPARSWRCAH